VVIEIGRLLPAELRLLRLFAETVVVPTAILLVLLRTAGVVAGLTGVLCWAALTMVARWVAGRRLPGTLLLCVGMLCGRTALALVLSSALVFVLQPIIGSVIMAILFLGSAAVGRPITMRLARDFVTLPTHLVHRPEVRRIFTQVAVVWGGSRLLDAAMTVGFLRWGLEAGLFSRGVLSGALTALTIAVCSGWGWRSMRRLPGITLRRV
jgi:hypothetical protein